MIEFKNATKTYPDGKTAVNNVSLTFNTGEFIVFIGTSGSGKTTCLRLVNRMIDLTEGQILIDGEDIAQLNEVNLRRRIGYVIQQVGLMSHMTIYDNIVMVPRLLKWDKKRQRETALRLMERVNLPESILDHYPSELSGGQQQRIGVIRALAADQAIILMDEPFGALDPITRLSLQQLIKELQQDLKKTLVFVTHDIDEALTLADKIVIMDEGRVVQFDTPENILKKPANSFVKEMLGDERIRQAKFDALTIAELMMHTPATIQNDMPLGETLKLMCDNRTDISFVTDQTGVLQGMIDIFTIDLSQNRSSLTREVIKDCCYIYDNTNIRNACFAIYFLDFKYLPIVNHQKKLVGVLSKDSIINLVCEQIWSIPSSDIEQKDFIQKTNG